MNMTDRRAALKRLLMDAAQIGWCAGYVLQDYDTDIAELAASPAAAAIIGEEPSHAPGGTDEQMLWSLLRSVLSQGACIQQDYKDKPYNEFSNRLDLAATDRLKDGRLQKVLANCPLVKSAEERERLIDTAAYLADGKCDCECDHDVGITQCLPCGVAELGRWAVKVLGGTQPEPFVPRFRCPHCGNDKCVTGFEDDVICFTRYCAWSGPRAACGLETPVTAGDDTLPPTINMGGYHAPLEDLTMTSDDVRALLTDYRSLQSAAESEREDWRDAYETARFDLHQVSKECDELRAEVERLREAAQSSLSWLSSYPGGGAMKAYERLRTALTPPATPSTTTS